MPYQKVHEDFYDIFEKFLGKLQKLPNADPVEIVAFSVLVVFIATVVVIMIIPCYTCCHACCCAGSPDHKGRRIHVEPATQA
ncbi:small integral membrane protein 5 isoform X2 [Tiliqua scincoides]